MTIEIPKTEVIVTQRCLLRYPHESDIPYIWSASQWTGFNDGLSGEVPHAIEQLKPAMERVWARWEKGTNFYWTIETREERVFIGRIAINPFDDKIDHWSIGFWVHPVHQNRGFATESARAVLHFGFDRLKASTIVSGHAKWNEASGAVLRKIGMKRTGETERGFRKQGGWVTECNHAMSREEFLVQCGIRK